MVARLCNNENDIQQQAQYKITVSRAFFEMAEENKEHKIPIFHDKDGAVLHILDLKLSTTLNGS